jgi:hypothetical protein
MLDLSLPTRLTPIGLPGGLAAVELEPAPGLLLIPVLRFDYFSKIAESCQRSVRPTYPRAARRATSPHAGHHYPRRRNQSSIACCPTARRHGAVLSDQGMSRPLGGV